MLKQYEELAVLEQGDDGAIVSIRGQGGPSVLLGPAYMAHVDRVLVRVMAELDMYPLSGEYPNLKLLYAEVRTLISTYEETCTKYGDGNAPSATRSLASALDELAVLRKQLDSF